MIIILLILFYYFLLNLHIRIMMELKCSVLLSHQDYDPRGMLHYISAEEGE